ncbi:MAG TPA: hypothetical protein VM821_01590 [Abditibacteriaceae bacterium]|jgi:hypothetical protein|nr:hypothetical protein [Abditibacteriaceae bacterium]
MTLRQKLERTIAEFQLALGPEGDLEYRMNDKPRFVEAASEEWLDALIDIARDAPTRALTWRDKEDEEFDFDLAEVTADILRRFPDGVQKVAPLLENDQTRVLAFNILCWSCLPQALDFIEPFVARIQTLTPDEVCYLASALNNHSGARNDEMLAKILRHVPDYPLPPTLIWDLDWPSPMPYKTLYEMIATTRNLNPN